MTCELLFSRIGFFAVTPVLAVYAGEGKVVVGAAWAIGGVELVLRLRK